MSGEYATSTKGAVWHIVRTTIAGHERYPHRIDVGSRMVVHYMPEVVTVMREVARDDGIGHHECALCGATVHRRDRYCHQCGARFDEGESEEEER